MCGLAGFIDLQGMTSEETLVETASSMAGRLQHRGPDDEGIWTDSAAGVALGFRRLAIIDTSQAGHQPMTSLSGRYVIVYNGEVYNFEDIRRELQEGHPDIPFRGHSDTEVMLAAIERWGLDEAIRRFRGMFAIAVWDRRDRVLSLVRDRVGVKPLYYALTGHTFIFASEIKAFFALDRFQPSVSRSAVETFMRYGYVPAPRTIYTDVSKLLPGTILELQLPTGRPQIRRYWSAEDVADAGQLHPFAGSEEEAADELETLLRDAVRLRMISDVPLGVFLSGGIDSSVVVALMQSQSSRPVHTFTIGFVEDAYNEAKQARAIAANLGTDHTELYVSAADALGVVPLLPSMYDEPFADSSQIPTYLVSRLARRHVTVALSGDGGDELFGGYNRYVYGPLLWRTMRRIPKPARRIASRLISALGTTRWDSAMRRFGGVLPAHAQFAQAGEKMQKVARVLSAETPDEIYANLVTHWDDVVLDGDDVSEERAGHSKELASHMMLRDLTGYLPDDILVKLDRASMAVSLEAREPLLDHKVIEFAWSLPSHMRVHRGEGKRLLRRVLHRYIPHHLTVRPKTGFALPVGEWLRGPLRDWAEDLLREERLKREGFLASHLVREVWREHLTGSRNWQQLLWDVLMFESWLADRRTAASSCAAVAVGAGA